MNFVGLLRQQTYDSTPKLLKVLSFTIFILLICIANLILKFTFVLNIIWFYKRVLENNFWKILAEYVESSM